MHNKQGMGKKVSTDYATIFCYLVHLARIIRSLHAYICLLQNECARLMMYEMQYESQQ